MSKEINKDYSQHVKDMIKDGHLSEELEPLNCRCGCTEHEDRITSKGEYGVEELDRQCKKCGQYLGSWAYGFWVNNY